MPLPGGCAAAPRVTPPSEVCAHNPPALAAPARWCRAAQTWFRFFIGLRHSEDAWAEDGFTLVLSQIYNLYFLF